ncbi:MULTISPECIES: YdhR family protein [Rhodomicrobium]|uniref:YdhR family protein n=1 Tax=Rhodomicrobium TaxID=1068 RepID=UPI000B4B7F89|nr:MULTISPECIES: YdhR family protein [Rhodomicrobium]
MHIQIINFNLKDATEEQYRAIADSLAPTFAAMPGLLTKYWLGNTAGNSYGGVYVWRDRAAMQAFMSGEVAAAVLAHPNLANITSEDFGVLDAPTRVTRGLAAAEAAY